MAHPQPTQDQIIDETTERLQAWVDAERRRNLGDVDLVRMAAAAAVIGAQVERELSWRIGA